MKNYVILLAAGSGSRMEHAKTAKCFLKVNDLMLFQYALKTFDEVKDIDHIVVMVPEVFAKEISKIYQNNPKINVLSGGKTRQESVYKGLTYLKDKAKDEDIVLIHDAARPLLSKGIILNNIKTATTWGAALTAIPAINTIAEVNDEKIVNIPNRKVLYEEQTPASFKYGLIKKAHDEAIKNGVTDASDDCLLILKSGQTLHLVLGERNNFKITNDIDLKLFELIVKKN